MVSTAVSPSAVARILMIQKPKVIAGTFDKGGHLSICCHCLLYLMWEVETGRMPSRSYVVASAGRSVGVWTFGAVFEHLPGHCVNTHFKRLAVALDVE